MISGGAALAYADLLAETDRQRLRLAQLGLPAGSVVGLRADFSLVATAVLLAGLQQRLVLALLPRDRPLEECLLHCNASGWFTGSHEALWQPRAAGAAHPLVAGLIRAHDGGLAIFTSGTTGVPKVALHSADRFLAKFAGAGRRLRTLAFLLFDHVAGLDTLFYTLFAGGTLVVPGSRDVHSIATLIDAAQVEVLPASPSFLRLLSVAGSAETSNHPSLRIITYGSEPMDARTLAALNVRFPQTRIVQKYGTTETGAPRSESRGNDSLWLRFKSDVEARIVDGVLWLRGAGTFLGYLNAQSPMDAEGWYCTGDLVESDGEWLRIVGRASGLINVGGEKVTPEEVEQVVLGLEFVEAVVVSGEPHPLMGQIVVAQVAVRAGTDEREAARQIRQRCRERLAPFKVPVKIQFSDAALVGSRHKLRRAPVDS